MLASFHVMDVPVDSLGALRRKLDGREAVIGVVGMGYVGLPLALAWGDAGFSVIGLDIDARKTDRLSAGESYISRIPSDEIANAVRGKKLHPTRDFARVEECDAIVICVPTPLTEYCEPDLTFVRGSVDRLLPYLREDQILSLESTTFPGATEEEIAAKVAGLGLRVGENFFVVYSPQRSDPGSEKMAGKSVPKIVGGVTQNCLAAGTALYRAVTDHVVPVSSTRAAEFTQLLENIYRAVNIGLANEMKVIADRMGLDIWEAIEAAATKPAGFSPFYPGPGLGGHSIPVDPFYLTWKARRFGLHTRFIELAGEINRAMPEYVMRRTAEVLNAQRKPLNGSSILLLGVAYKADVDDLRGSPALHLMRLFSEALASVDYFDPHVPAITEIRDFPEFAGKRSIAWERSEIEKFDAVVLVTRHSALELREAADWSRCIIDTRNAFAGIEVREGTVFKA